MVAKLKLFSDFKCKKEIPVESDGSYTIELKNLSSSYSIANFVFYIKNVGGYLAYLMTFREIENSDNIVVFTFNTDSLAVLEVRPVNMLVNIPNGKTETTIKFRLDYSSI